MGHGNTADTENLEKRLEWMNERGVGMHVLTLSGSMPWQWASQDAANRLARAVNDAAIEAHKAFPSRFVAGVAMPMRDPVAALRELDRVVIGTDNYARMDVEQPNALVGELKLPAEDRERILRGNAARLLRL